MIIDKMKAVGYPANEVDDAVATFGAGRRILSRRCQRVPRDTIAEQVEAEVETTERKEARCSNMGNRENEKKPA
ncbi:MAG: hypothetical protein ACLTMP_11055 [Eggerthella lenta]